MSPEIIAGKHFVLLKSNLAFSVCFARIDLLCSTSHTVDIQEPPSFARSTRASRLRYNKSTTSRTKRTFVSKRSQSSPSTSNTRVSGLAIVHGRPYFYDNGNVKKMFGYLRPTKATLSRLGERGDSADESWSFDNTPECVPSKFVDEINQPPKLPTKIMTQIMTQAQFDDRTERLGILLRTRLRDNAWLQEPTNNGMLDDDDLFDLLTRAERLAKRCLFRWLRTNRADRCDWFRLDYVSDMDLGRESVESLTRPEDFFCYRHTQTHEVRSTIQCLIELRNWLHHFSGGRSFSMDDVDRQLYIVQLLAVQLYDEESAGRARSLRDRLHRKAEHIAGEIESMGLLTALPFASEKPWQHHHLKLFAHVAYRMRWSGYDYVRCRYSSSVMEATEECLTGKISYHCIPDIEESLAKAQLLETGGHAEALTSGPDGQRGRIAAVTLPNRMRNSSVNGPRRLSAHMNGDDI